MKDDKKFTFMENKSHLTVEIYWSDESKRSFVVEKKLAE